MLSLEQFWRAFGIWGEGGLNTPIPPRNATAGMYWVTVGVDFDSVHARPAQ